MEGRGRSFDRSVLRGGAHSRFVESRSGNVCSAALKLTEGCT